MRSIGNIPRGRIEEDAGHSGVATSGRRLNPKMELRRRVTASFYTCRRKACEAKDAKHGGHYRCSEDGELECFDGWTGDLCNVPFCKPGDTTYINERKTLLLFDIVTADILLNN